MKPSLQNKRKRAARQPRGPRTFNIQKLVKADVPPPKINPDLLKELEVAGMIDPVPTDLKNMIAKFDKIERFNRELQLKRNIDTRIKDTSRRETTALFLHKRALEARNRRIQRYSDGFKKKHKEGLLDAIQKAKSGNTRHLFKLLEWDLKWLYAPWAKEGFLQAAVENNRDFLERLGDAIKRNRSFPGRTKHKERLELLRKVIGNEGHNIEWVKSWCERLNREGLIGEKLSDEDYFLKFLKRHQLA